MFRCCYNVKVENLNKSRKEKNICGLCSKKKNIITLTCKHMICVSCYSKYKYCIQCERENSSGILC